MPAEEFPDMDAKGPHSMDNSPVGLHLYVKDVDVAAQKAIQASLKSFDHLNDQMVNLSRPITVVTTGTVTYEGIIQPTIRVLLREARFRQDPRTLYPASLTINVPAGKQ